MRHSRDARISVSVAALVLGTRQAVLSDPGGLCRSRRTPGLGAALVMAGSGVNSVPPAHERAPHAPGLRTFSLSFLSPGRLHAPPRPLHLL